MVQSFQVHCICGGFGFPTGTASTKRVMLMGRALNSAGILFHVWHIGPSSYPENTQKEGELHGVTWKYLSPSTKRPKNQILRLAYFLCGCLFLPFHLVRHRRNIVVYLYYQGDIINLWGLMVCRMLDIPVVQECCEWWPGTPDETRFARWMYQCIMFRWSMGALPISTLIERRIRKAAAEGYPILKVPVLVDVDEVRREADVKPATPATDQPYLFWCGMMDGYSRDPFFLIRVMGEVWRRHGKRLRLLLAGPCSSETQNDLIKAAADSGLKPDQVVITGFIPEAELFRLATHATALLLPLWNDDRSSSRFPTKIGLYAAAASPIVVSPVGEIPRFFQDEKTAIFAPPGDEAAWADATDRLVKDENLGHSLSARIMADVLPQLEYRCVGQALREWFGRIYKLKK